MISKIRQLYINRHEEKLKEKLEEKLEMILNITDGNPMDYKEQQNKEGGIIMLKHYKEGGNRDRIPAVTLDITDWVKYGDQEDPILKETMKNNPKLIKLL